MNNIDILGFLRGKKTFMVALGLIAYMGRSAITGEPADPNIVYALLGGGMWTLRLGMNGAK